MGLMIGTSLQKQQLVTRNYPTNITAYEGDKVILETDENGKETARNIYGTNLLQRTVTTRENGTTKEEAYSYMYNGHGDVTALLGTDGTEAASYYYDAFGSPLETHYYNAAGTEISKAVDNPYRYAGYVYDNTTDLYYLNARMYDAKTARFMQEDTYLGNAGDPLSLNLYTYCHNEPVMYSDPTGHYKEDDEKYSANVQKLLYEYGQAYANATKDKDKKDAANAAAKLRDYANETKSFITTPKSMQKAIDLDEALKLTAAAKAASKSSTTTANVSVNKSTTDVGRSTSGSNAYVGNTVSTGTGNSGIQQSGIAVPIVPPVSLPIAVPNPIIVGAEIVLINLLTPTVVSGGDLTYDQIQQNKADAKAKADAIAQTITGAKDNPDKGTIIYRWGSNTNTNLTPKEKDIGGLSFPLTPPPSGNYCATTIELINMSGYLIAVKDGANHVSVRTIDPSKMPGWIASRPTAETEPMIYTAVLKEIVIKLK